MLDKKLVNKLGGVQGDVPVTTVDSLTPGGKLTARRIVAYGESTGHHHELIGECDVYEVKRDVGGQLFEGLEVVVVEDKPVQLFHKSNGEHLPLQLVPGIYFIPLEIQQVEYDGSKERRIAD